MAHAMLAIAPNRASREIFGDTTSQVIIDGTPKEIGDFSPESGWTGTWSLAILRKVNNTWTVCGGVVEAQKDSGSGTRLYWYWDSGSPWDEDFCLSSNHDAAWSTSTTPETFTSTDTLTLVQETTADLQGYHDDQELTAFCIQWCAPGATVPEGVTNEAGLVGKAPGQMLWWRGQNTAYTVNNSLYFVKSGCTIPERDNWYKAEDDGIS